MYFIGKRLKHYSVSFGILVLPVKFEGDFFFFVAKTKFTLKARLGGIISHAVTTDRCIHGHVSVNVNCQRQTTMRA